MVTPLVILIIYIYIYIYTCTYSKKIFTVILGRFFFSLSFDRIGYAVWVIQNIINSNEEKDIQIKLMYDIACILAKHLQVRFNGGIYFLMLDEITTTNKKKTLLISSYMAANDVT